MRFPARTRQVQSAAAETVAHPGVRAKFQELLNELAAELSVTPRTIRRDLEAIDAAALPLRKVLGDDGQRRWRLDRYGGDSVTSLVSQP